MNSIFRYPKDAEKHLLALKSGLTRSQVIFPFPVLFFVLGVSLLTQKDESFRLVVIKLCLSPRFVPHVARSLVKPIYLY